GHAHHHHHHQQHHAPRRLVLPHIATTAATPGIPLCNGESDVDIELDETDEESDDEACGEVDKENQPPTDCPADVDIEPQPAKHAKPQGQNYKIYADNYFTSVPLIEKLLYHGIHYVGTARQVRLPNCNLEDDKSLKKKGRGTFDYRVEVKHNISAVKWYDNRAVTLVSSFAGTEPVQNIQRWDKANNTYSEVERPYIVGTYNKYMGGVDLLDSFTAKYKFPLKSRR
ncbi:hypothetical protein CRUP_027871, partial [Coryphaenoides rupestris]